MSTLENEEKNGWSPKIYHWELGLRKIMGMKNIRHCQQVYYINGSGTYITVELMWCLHTRPIVIVDGPIIVCIIFIK